MKSLSSISNLYLWMLSAANGSVATMISDSELLQWNHQGLIPAPDESEERFRKRALYCLQIRQKLIETPEMVDYGVQLPQAEAALTEGHQQTNSLYDMAPTWVPVFFSNSQLAPWHGGCATIFQISDDSPTSAFLQLRAVFKDRTSF